MMEQGMSRKQRIYSTAQEHNIQEKATTIRICRDGVKCELLQIPLLYRTMIDMHQWQWQLTIPQKLYMKMISTPAL